MRQLVFAMWAVAAVLSGQPASPPGEVLRNSTDREALERAAVALGRSAKPGDIALLGQSLRNREFLARLDNLNDLPTRHFGRVIKALEDHPSPEVIKLCEMLADDPASLEKDRKSFVLELLAFVKPMSEQTAAIFARSNEQGYFAFAARLLAQNGSPRALALFESMMLDQSVEAESRVECLHKGIVPRRTDASILSAADRILSRTAERPIAAAVVESVFDYRQNWFGIDSGMSGLRPWKESSPEALRAVLRLADRALTRGEIGGPLREKIRGARAAIEALR